MKKTEKKKRVKIVESSSGSEESDYNIDEEVVEPKRNRKSLHGGDRKPSREPNTKHIHFASS